MLLIAFRAINAVFAVVVAVLITGRFGGDTPRAKIVAVLITAGVVAFVELLGVWAPKRSRTARRVLDSRSLFEGIWMQDVVNVDDQQGSTSEHPNRFAVFTVQYSRPINNYNVEGTAYDSIGREHAHWESTEVVHFAQNGRGMTYQWTGKIRIGNKNANEKAGPERPDRGGFARLTLSSENGGRGRVDHVAMNINLDFNIFRLTKNWLAENNLQFQPERLREPDYRNRFALEYAKKHLGSRPIGPAVDDDAAAGAGASLAP